MGFPPTLLPFQDAQIPRSKRKAEAETACAAFNTLGRADHGPGVLALTFSTELHALQYHSAGKEPAGCIL